MPTVSVRYFYLIFHRRDRFPVIYRSVDNRQRRLSCTCTQSTTHNKLRTYYVLDSMYTIHFLPEQSSCIIVYKQFGLNFSIAPHHHRTWYYYNSRITCRAYMYKKILISWTIRLVYLGKISYILFKLLLYF
jgi:hypothetical protein